MLRMTCTLSGALGASLQRSRLSLSGTREASLRAPPDSGYPLG